MKRKPLIILIVIVLTTSIYLYLTQDFDKTSTTLYENGTIITIEDSQPIATAMLVENGIIQAIGSTEKVKKQAPADTRIIDLQGKVIMPGFIDPHTHVALSAFLEDMVDLSGFKHKNAASVWQHLEKSIKNHQPGEWIVGKGIDPILVSDLKTPDIHYLDQISPDNPLVLISQSLHTYWANSLAFKVAGIDKSTPDPSSASFYEKDSNGELTGLIAEQEAFLPILDVIKKEKLTPKNLITSTVNVLRQYAKNGNTTVVSAGITINNEKPLRLYKHLSSDKPGIMNLLLASFGVLPERTPTPRHFIYIRFDRASLLPEHKDNNDFYSIIGIKHWYDGAPYTGSMYIREPYLDTPLTTDELHIPVGYRGKSLVSKDDLIAFIKKYDKLGWQVAIHVQGDIANEEVLEAYELAGEESVMPDPRHRIEHCLLFPETDMVRLQESNITPSFHINHLYYYGQALTNSILGEERTNKILPVGTAQKLGLKYSLHADQPMFASKPFRLIQTAVERQTIQGDTIRYEQRISVLDGLKAMTINAAWQIHKEDKLGSLKVGKYADFIVLDKNPLEIPAHELDQIKILQTFINGNEVN